MLGAWLHCESMPESQLRRVVRAISLTEAKRLPGESNAAFASRIPWKERRMNLANEDFIGSGENLRKSDP